MTQLPQLYEAFVRLEDKLNRKIRSLSIGDCFHDSPLLSCASTGSSLGVIYGSPKVHKDGCPLRPVLASYNTHNYKLAKYLCNILSPYTCNNFSTLSSQQFAQKIRTVPSNGVMVSFDVASLFTSVPLEETIDIIVDTVFNSQDVFHGFDRRSFTEVLRLASTDTYFMFDGEVYRQTDGVAMGSPLGPTFANIFMCHLEKLFTRCDSQPSFYTRYVDDTFCIFQSSRHAAKFFEFINELHPNIQFTMEEESDGKLAFLDVSVRRMDDTFQTEVFRKPCFTPLSTNFFSFSSFKYRISGIVTLISRAYTHSSTYYNFHKEIVYLLNIASKNSIPSTLFYNLVSRFLSSIYRPRFPVCTVPKLSLYFKYPYIGETELISFKREISSIFNRYYPSIDIKLIPYNLRTIQSYFKFKDPVSRLMMSGVVYMYSCPRCSRGTYIGSTSRRLRDRICEHMGISHRTLTPLNSKQPSPIYDHAKKCGAPIRFQDFTILRQDKNDTLRTCESLFIHQLQPTLNNDQKSTQLFI